MDYVVSHIMIMILVSNVTIHHEVYVIQFKNYYVYVSKLFVQYIVI